MRISTVVKENEPQLVRKLYDKAKEYKNVIDLTLGDPDIPPPVKVKNAACQAIEENKTKYTANAGIPRTGAIRINCDVFHSAASDVSADSSFSVLVMEMTFAPSPTRIRRTPCVARP